MTSEQAFKKLWKSLVEVEDYIAVELPEQLATAVKFGAEDMQPVHDALSVFRRVRPFLTPDTRRTADSALSQLTAGLEEFLSVIGEFVAVPRSNQDKRKSVLNRVRKTIVQVFFQYKDAIREVADSYQANTDTPTPRDSSTYDAFICHASEDKDSLVEPLAESLIREGCRIWYDDFQLTVGDSLRRSIDRGLTNSHFGIVVLSPSFFAKNWPQYELDGLVNREMIEGTKVILPLWHKVSKEDVQCHSPSLADKVALRTASYTLGELVKQLAGVLKPSAA